MLIRVTSKRQVAFPVEVLEAMGVRPGDHIELVDGPDGYVLRARRIDLSRLAPLRDQIPPDSEPFDIHSFRVQRRDPALRD